MYDVLTTLTGTTSLAPALTAPFSGALIPMEGVGIVEWLTNLIGDVTTLVKLMITLALLGGGAVIIVKGRGSVKAVLMAGVLCALTWWLLLAGGFETVGKLMGNQVDQTSAAAAAAAKEGR